MLKRRKPARLYSLPPGTYNPPLGKPGSGMVPICPKCRRWMLAAWRPFNRGPKLIAWCDHGTGECERFEFMIADGR